MRRFRQGEEDAATELFMKYARRVHALAKSQTSTALAARFDPDDVVQSVFRSFFRRAADGFYSVPPGDELWQLLLVLTINKVRSLAVHHRAQKRDATKTVVTEGKDWVGAYEADDFAHKTLEMVIEDILSELPETNRKVVELRIEGHEVQEIADLTQRSKRTVERILQQFRQRLTEMIESES